MSLLNNEKVKSFFSHYMSTAAVFVMDFFLSVVSSVVTLLCANLLAAAHSYTGMFALSWLTGSIVFTLVAQLASHSYKIIIRHSRFRDVLKFIIADALKIGLMAIGIFASSAIFGFKISANIVILLLFDFLFTLAALIGVRVCMIAVYGVYSDKLNESVHKKRVLIYSTNEKSVALVARLASSPHYRVVGFLSPSLTKEKKIEVAGVRVYFPETAEAFKDLASGLGVSCVLFSKDEDVRKELDRVVRFSSDAGVKVLLAPHIDEYSEGVKTNKIREVKIEDLLGRDEIKISLNEIKANFRDKTVMVTGAAGSIGSELCRQLAGFGIGRLVLFDNAETPMHYLRLELEDRFPGLDFIPVIGDVRINARLDYAFRKWHPQVVFHAAAYKHVPLMEENPCEAVLVNVVGSRQVADKCLEYDVEKMVMISTDKAVNPTNVMGCSKRLAEIYVQSLGLALASGKVKGKTKFVTTRFGNVLGSNGSVIPRFRDQIAKGGPVTVTHPEINRFFMTIPEACRLVMEAATISTGNQIVVFDMGQPVKIDTLARKMIELAGLKPDVDIQIQYTGLRPGEKLYEEVLSNVENTDPTSHDRIRIARVREYDYEDAQAYVDKLNTLSRAVEIPETVKLMKQIVPEFVSNNSQFSEYDSKK